MDLDFSGLQQSFHSPSVGHGRASQLSNATRAASLSFDTDTVFSFDSSFSDVSSPVVSSASDSDSEGPVAVPPLRRRATTPCHRRPPPSREVSVPARRDTGGQPSTPVRIGSRAQAPLHVPFLSYVCRLLRQPVVRLRRPPIS